MTSIIDAWLTSGSRVSVTANATVEDSNIEGKDLGSSENITLRPLVLTSEHVYNLRNQTWARPRADWDIATNFDPIGSFRYRSATQRFPSNADTVNPFLYANTAATTGDKELTRFHAEDCVKNPYGNTRAPMGYFIIDALERGVSRKERLTALYDQHSNLIYNYEELPNDTTPGGVSLVESFAGRIFYAGFSGEVVDGDNNSPKLSSYILYSQLVEDVSDINSCYQKNDPTNKDLSDLLDTDGGFIRLDSAYGINGLVNVGGVLVVFGANGVWTITGGNNYGFTATNYMVKKISNYGCISTGSIVQVDSSIFYFGNDGIYVVSKNQFGDYLVNNVSNTTIQSFYNSIDSTQLMKVDGVYDEYEKKIKWIIYNNGSTTNETIVFSLDTILNAWEKHSIKKLGGNRYPLLVGSFSTNPFKLISNANDVYVDADPVLVSADQVVVDEVSTETNVRGTKYLVITDVSGNINYNFALFTDADHYDWKSIDGTGVDAKSFLLTGQLIQGDFQRNKSVVYLTMHFNKTETGFTTDSGGDFVPTNQSSCLVQSRWNWTDLNSSGKWGTQFEAYRIRRPYMTTTIDSTYDDGYPVVETRSKLRGIGKVLSLYMESQPGKHCEVLGWSMIVKENGNV